MKSVSLIRNKEFGIQNHSPLAWVASLFFKGRPTAMVLGRTIHLSGVSSEEFLQDRRWVLHELEHIRQFKEYGFFSFLFLYFVESLRNGYYNNRFEIEARKAENE
jgi:hypothetical protein